MPILTLFAPFKNFFLFGIPPLYTLPYPKSYGDSNYYRLPLYFPVGLRCLLFVPGEKWPTSLGLVVKQVIKQKDVWRACPMNFESN